MPMRIRLGDLKRLIKEEVSGAKKVVIKSGGKYVIGFVKQGGKLRPRPGNVTDDPAQAWQFTPQEAEKYIGKYGGGGYGLTSPELEDAPDGASKSTTFVPWKGNTTQGARRR